MSPLLRTLGAGLAAGVLAVAGGDAALARGVGPQAQVGIPGCADDVPVRAAREAITFESRDREIRALLYTPREPNGRGVVMLHGGTGFEMNSILFDAHAIQLASRGYWVMLPAYFDAAAPGRGRTVAARAWTRAAIDAARELQGRPAMSAGGVTFWGYSRGAGVAADAVTQADSPVSAAVLAAGGGTFDEPLERDGVSVLMLHARRDEAVPVRATLRLAEDLRAAGAEVEVQALDFDGHQYDLPTWCAVMGRTRDFMERRGTGGDGPT